MNATTTTDRVTTLQKSTLEKEVDGLQHILDQRRKWLNNPDNKARKTYNAVVRDTNEIQSQLDELNEELNNQKL